MTINAFGIFDDIDYEQPFDVTDTKRLFHSMFQIWSPQVLLRIQSQNTEAAGNSAYFIATTLGGDGG